MEQKYRCRRVEPHMWPRQDEAQAIVCKPLSAVVHVPAAVPGKQCSRLVSFASSKTMPKRGKSSFRWVRLKSTVPNHRSRCRVFASKKLKRPGCVCRWQIVSDSLLRGHDDRTGQRATRGAAHYTDRNQLHWARAILGASASLSAATSALDVKSMYFHRHMSGPQSRE